MENIINVNEDGKKERGEYEYQPTPRAETMEFYQVLTVNYDEDLHVVKQDQSKMKDRRILSRRISYIKRHIGHHLYYMHAYRR